MSFTLEKLNKEQAAGGNDKPRQENHERQIPAKAGKRQRVSAKH